MSIQIYRITNDINNKLYIGITTRDIELRFAEHKQNARVNSPSQRIHQAMKKHGVDRFKIELIEKVETLVEADKREKFWIDFHNSTEYSVGYNMSKGGAGKSMDLTLDDREKIRSSVQAHRDSLSDDQRKQMTQAVNEFKRGRKEKPTDKKKISQKLRWENASVEDRLAHSESVKIGFSPEGRERATQALINAYSPAREPGVKKPQVACPHCGKVGGAPIMKRYHFDRCKEKVVEYILSSRESEESGSVPLR